MNTKNPIRHLDRNSITKVFWPSWAAQRSYTNFHPASPRRVLTNESVSPRRTGGSFVNTLNDRSNGINSFRITHA